MVMPGDNFQGKIPQDCLSGIRCPSHHSSFLQQRKAPVALALPVAMEAGLRFAVRDSGRTVGAGVVTKVLK